MRTSCAAGDAFSATRQARQVAPVSEEWVQARLKDARWVATARAVAKPELVHEVLEGAALMAGQPRGTNPRRVLRGRFKSVAILDEESLLATCAYIDLNPVAAGIAEVPEATTYLDQATGRACQGTGTSRGPEGRPTVFASEGIDVWLGGHLDVGRLARRGGNRLACRR